MQPNTQRPVMDVKFPNRAAATAPAGRPTTPPAEPAAPASNTEPQSTSMTVHEPPKAQSEPAAPAASPAKTEQPKPEPKQKTEDKSQQASASHLKPGATQGGSGPTGVIVATVFVMIVLIGLTVMAYISSNS